MSTTYTIKAQPLATGGWSLVVDGVGVSQVRRLEQAEDEMRSALSDLTGRPADDAIFVLETDLPAEVTQRMDAVERDQAEAERLSREAREARRELVVHLNQQMRLPVRDIAAIMGLSHQRVSAMMKAPAGHRSMSTGLMASSRSSPFPR